MEHLSGVKQKETMSLSQLLLPESDGRTVKVNGAVHTIRDMGTVAFVVLRKSEGLVQCVYEEGVSSFEIQSIKEAATIEVSGTLLKNEKAPNGIEIKMDSVKILSEPAEPLPIAISKWKMNTSLETRLNLRPISMRNLQERAKFVKISAASLKESHPHDIHITKEAPNYSVDE